MIFRKKINPCNNYHRSVRYAYQSRPKKNIISRMIFRFLSRDESPAAAVDLVPGVMEDQPPPPPPPSSSSGKFVFNLFYSDFLI